MLSNQVVTASGGSKKHPNVPSTLFVNNIDPSIDKPALNNLFSRYGTVLSINLNKDSSKKNKSYGFIVFAEVKQAELAKQKFEYYKLGNYELIIMFAADKPKLKQEGKIFIKNIPVQVKHMELHQLFATVSPNLIVHISYEEKHKNSLVTGYAHYFNPSDATKAIETLQNCELAGEKLELSSWLTKDERQIQPPEKKNLYIGNIPLGDKETIEHVLKSLLETFGEIESLMLKKSEGAAFYSASLSYKSAEDAEKAYESLNKFPTGIVGSHEPLYVNWHQTREERTKERHKEGNRDNLYIRNLLMSVTEQDLRTLFGKYGEVKNIELRPWTAPSGKNEAQFAFVSFKDPEEAEKALDNAPADSEIQNLFLSKAKIYIRFFVPKNEREQEVKKIRHSQQQIQQQFQPVAQVQKPASRARRSEASNMKNAIGGAARIATTTTTTATASHIRAPNMPIMTPQPSMYQSYPINNPSAPPMYGQYQMQPMAAPMHSNGIKGMNLQPSMNLPPSSNIQPSVNSAHMPMSYGSNNMMYQPFQPGQPLNKNLPFEERREKAQEKESKSMSTSKPMLKAEKMVMKKSKMMKEEEEDRSELPLAKKKSSTLASPLGLFKKASTLSTSSRTSEKIEIEHDDEEVQSIIESNKYDDAQKQFMLARVFETKQEKPHAKF